MRANVDLLRERSSAAAHALPEEYFLFVGRLAEEKNVTGLIKAWLDYRAQGGAWSLVLAGDGPERKAVEDLLAGSAHRDEVFLLGHKSSRELIPLFAFARCFVLPSTREPWGLVVNEAMAACLPLIVSTRCGCAEDLVVEGENGFLFDPGDQNALVSCLLRTEALPEGERQRRGLSSAAKVSVYSPQNFGQEIVRISDWAEARRPAGRVTGHDQQQEQRTAAERIPRRDDYRPRAEGDRPRMMLTAQDELERVPGVPLRAPARPTQRVVQVISHLDPKLGGISAVVPTALRGAC